MTTKQEMAAKFRELGKLSLPAQPDASQRRGFVDRQYIWRTDCKHRLTMQQSEAGRLLADALDGGFIVVPATEARTMLADLTIAGRSSAALASWFVAAIGWFRRYGHDGALPNVVCKFPPIEEEDDTPAHRRIERPAMLPHEAFAQHCAFMRDVLFALAELIEGQSEPQLARPFAVRSGTTLRCVTADSHLNAACDTAGGLLDDNGGSVPAGCLAATLSVVEMDSNLVKEVTLARCIEEMVLLSPNERDSLERYA